MVDDEPAIRNLERAILRDAGYRVLTAENGLRALEIVEEEHPSVVVLDMQMPVMDGREFFRSLERRKQRPPVLVVTSEEASQLLEELGVDDALRKPFLPEELVERVEALKDAS